MFGKLFVQETWDGLFIPGFFLFDLFMACLEIGWRYAQAVRSTANMTSISRL
jgi:hypothetical protein